MNKIIYSIKVMKALVERGFIPIATIPNPQNSKFNCWVFEVTDDFQQILDEIMEGLRND